MLHMDTKRTGKTRRESRPKWTAVTIDRETMDALAELSEKHSTTPPKFLRAMIDHAKHMPDADRAQLLTAA